MKFIRIDEYGTEGEGKIVVRNVNYYPVDWIKSIEFNVDENKLKIDLKHKGFEGFSKEFFISDFERFLSSESKHTFRIDIF